MSACQRRQAGSWQRHSACQALIRLCLRASLSTPAAFTPAHSESLSPSHRPKDSPPPEDQDPAEPWKPTRDEAAKCLLAAPTGISYVVTMLAGGQHGHTYKFTVTEKVDYNDGGLCFQLFFFPVNNQLVKQKQLIPHGAQCLLQHLQRQETGVYHSPWKQTTRTLWFGE